MADSTLEEQAIAMRMEVEKFYRANRDKFASMGMESEDERKLLDRTLMPSPSPSPPLPPSLNEERSAEPASELAKGTRVRLEGLVNAASLNGSVGSVVKTWDSDGSDKNARVGVKLEGSGRLVKILRKNLKVVVQPGVEDEQENLAALFGADAEGLQDVWGSSGVTALLPSAAVNSATVPPLFEATAPPNLAAAVDGTGIDDVLAFLENTKNVDAEAGDGDSTTSRNLDQLDLREVLEATAALEGIKKQQEEEQHGGGGAVRRG